jgi:hypothetical protein
VKPASGAIPDGSDATGSRVAARSIGGRVRTPHGSGLPVAATAGLLEVAMALGPGEVSGELGRDWSTSPAAIAMTATTATNAAAWGRLGRRRVVPLMARLLGCA